MDKGLTVPKWVLIVRPKILQMPQNLSAQFVCPSPKALDFNEKRLHWASVVRVCDDHLPNTKNDKNFIRSCKKKMAHTNFGIQYSKVEIFKEMLHIL